MDCIVCSGYVTVVAMALAMAPITKTSSDDSFGQKEEPESFVYHQRNKRIPKVKVLSSDDLSNKCSLKFYSAYQIFLS